MKSGGFDPKKDAVVKIDLLKVAQKLNESVEMSDHDFRVMLKDIFDSVPTYHINQIVKVVKKGNKEYRFERLSRMVRDA